MMGRLSLTTASWFSYNISRTYPYSWFSPVALAILVISTALFTFLNFVSQGYELQVQTSANPNATEAGDTWLSNWPSFIFNSRPSCEPGDIAVGSQFFTNQTALTYTLNAIWQQNDTGVHILSSLPYFNNVLEDCQISSIDIDIESWSRNPSQIAYTIYGETVRTYVQCSTITSSGRIRFNITQEYNYIPPDISMISSGFSFLGTNFLERNNLTKASLWWGESLMSTYWCIVCTKMQAIALNQSANGSGIINQGTLYSVPQHQSELSRLDFFKVNYRFMGSAPFDGVFIWPGLYNDTEDVNRLSTTRSYPDIWIPADRLAKSAYSTVLLDLGQTKNKANILTDPELLQDYTQVFEVWQEDDSDNNCQPGPAITSFDALKEVTGPLGTTPSVISTQYVCSVPKQKSISNLIVSILVADVVFVQVTWQIFKWIVGTFFLRKDTTAQYCEGCFSAMQREPDNEDNRVDAQPLNSDKGLVYSRISSSIRDTASNLSNRRDSEDEDGSVETLQHRDEH